MAKAKAPAKKPDRRGTPKGKATGAGKGKGGGGKIGNPPFVPTDQQRRDVMLWVATGNSYPMIAAKLQISESTLTKHFRQELDEGLTHANAMLGGVLYKKAASGDIRAIEQWYDRRGGPDWRKKTAHEHSGPNGKPISTRDVSKLTDAQLDALAALDDDDPE